MKMSPESLMRIRDKKRTTEEKERDSSDPLEMWSMFVNFSQYGHKDDDEETTNMFTEQWDPYKASFQHVAVYLGLLKDVGELSEVELDFHKEVLLEYNGVSESLPHLQLELKDVHDILNNADTDVKEPKNLRSYMDYTQNFTSFISGSKAWRLFVDFCQKNQSTINPFFDDQNVVMC